ncbi:MAG TPA: DUF4331 family protein [Ktedonobacteraceae bacterium]
MSHHNSGLGLGPLSMDARSHLTDLFVFQKPGDPNKTILVANINPRSPMWKDAINPESAYQFLIDTDASARASVALWVRFSPIQDGKQSATVWLAQGKEQIESPFSGKTIIRGGSSIVRR